MNPASWSTCLPPPGFPRVPQYHNNQKCCPEPIRPQYSNNNTFITPSNIGPPPGFVNGPSISGPFFVCNGPPRGQFIQFNNPNNNNMINGANNATLYNNNVPAFNGSNLIANQQYNSNGFPAVQTQINVNMAAPRTSMRVGYNNVPMNNVNTFHHR